ncbi:MAG: DUF819 domain-containing protein [Pyramidobacter sp.]|jgi:uncharacterized membrane protein
MGSLIKPDDTIYIWAVLISVLCLANWLDQRYKWANKLSIVVLCIVGGMALANMHILPFKSPVYTSISRVLLYTAIPMLLFKSDLRKIYREGGRIFVAFNLASISSIIAGFIYGMILKRWGAAELPAMVAMNVGGSIGGTVNMVAMAGVFNASENLLSANAMLGNFNLGIMLFILALVVNSKFYRRIFKHPYVEAREAAVLADPEAAKRPLSAAFWKCRELSLLDILKTFATSFVIVALSRFIANVVTSLKPPFVIQQLFGSIWLVMTTLSCLGATFMPRWFSSLKFGDEFGMIILTLWYVTIGTSADLVKIVEFGSIVMLIFFVTLGTHLIVSFLIGKIFRLSLEEICCAVTATIGGPSSSAALTINHGWSTLIAPTILCALYGYIIGNYFGVMMGNYFLFM